MANRTKLTPRARARFLEVLRERGNVSAAAHAIGMSRTGVYDAKEADEAFSAAWDDAVETACDTLEAEAWRRGVEGVERPLTGFGKLVKDDNGKVVTVRDYSDNLLLAQLKAHRPEKYRENINVTGTMTVELSSRMDAAIKRMEQLAEERRQSFPAPKVIDVEAVPAPAPGQVDSSD
jgi:hypothetical protein